MTIEEFILTRLDQDIDHIEIEYAGGFGLVAAIREIVEWHKNWPVLVTGEMETTVFDDYDIAFNKISLKINQKIEWMTQQEYIRRFGETPPTAPILKIIAATWKDHHEYKEEWACEL